MSQYTSPRVGLLSLGVGLAAAGVGAAIGLAAERAAVRRRPDGESEDVYGSLRGRIQAVTAADGAALHVEVDEADPEHVPGGRRPAPTLVFSHGYCLNQDSWHFQRQALRGRYRMVFWDHRGHGRSGTGPLGSATIDQLGDDLFAVLDAVAPAGPLVLIGHSMGGMAIMSLAERYPQLLDDRVLGAVLVSTSAGGLGQVTLGLPRLGRVVRWVAPGTVRALARVPSLVERGRRIGSDLETVVVRRYSYASGVPDVLVRFTADMIAATQLDVISDFLPTFAEHDKRAALAGLNGLDVLIVVGDSDLLTPVQHSEEIVRQLPGAEFVVVREGGHLLMLEHHEVVTGHLVELVERSQWAVSSGDGPGLRGLRRRTVTSLRRRHRHRGGAG